MKKFPVILLPKEKLVDTNGAGTALLLLRVQMWNLIAYAIVFISFDFYLHGLQR